MLARHPSEEAVVNRAPPCPGGFGGLTAEVGGQCRAIFPCLGFNLNKGNRVKASARSLPGGRGFGKGNPKNGFLKSRSPNGRAFPGGFGFGERFRLGS